MNTDDDENFEHYPDGVYYKCHGCEHLIDSQEYVYRVNHDDCGFYCYECADRLGL